METQQKLNPETLRRIFPLHILQLVFINLPRPCISHGWAVAGNRLILARLDFLHDCIGSVPPSDVLCASPCQVYVVEMCPLLLLFLVCMLLIEYGTEIATGWYQTWICARIAHRFLHSTQALPREAGKLQNSIHHRFIQRVIRRRITKNLQLSNKIFRCWGKSHFNQSHPADCKCGWYLGSLSILLTTSYHSDLLRSVN